MYSAMASIFATRCSMTALGCKQNNVEVGEGLGCLRKAGSQQKRTD